MINFRYLVRDLRHSPAQSLTFVLCVMLSIATLIGLNSFKRDVHRSLLNDSQALHGGDVIVHSHQPISADLERAATELAAQGRLQATRTYEFYTVVRPAEATATLFADIKAVEPAYPLYGRIKLRSGAPFSEALRPGRVVVAPDVLDRLAVRIGATLHIGEAVLAIGDVIEFDPSRPVSVFALGPRIYVSTADLERLNLLGSRSRSTYELLVKLEDPAQADSIAATLAELTSGRQARVSTAANARSQVKRFFDNLMFFLSFVSIFTLLLSGIGMQSSLTAMMRQKIRTIGVMKAVGASHRFLLGHYLSLVAILGLAGCLGGIAAGYGIKLLFPRLFRGLLPAPDTLGVNPADLAEGIVLGLLVVLLFTILPLTRLRSVKPVAVFRYEPGRVSASTRYLAAGLTLVLLTLLVIRQLEDVRTAVYFVFGCLALVLLVFLVTAAILAWLRRRTPASPALRQAIRSLDRPGNATRPIIVTLASALAVLLTIYQLQFNLFSSFVDAYPADAPNLFCLDIQPDQKETFKAIVGADVELFPVIRARLQSINGESIDYARERQRKSDNLAREFNLTYRDHLLKDEVIRSGRSLFGDRRVADGVVEVSVLDTIADIGSIVRGDRLVFNVQGVPLEAEVTTIRSRTKSKLFPFFYFVFPESVLEDAPQTLFAALHLERQDIAPTINRIVRELPNVSAVNAAATAERLGELIGRLAGIITFFALFSIAAGGLIMVSAAFATRLDRIRESVYYKLLGAKSGFVLLILVYENILLGLISSLIAILCATAGAWLLCRYTFEIPFRPDPLAPFVLIALVVGVVVGLGVFSSRSVIREKPAVYLRQHHEV